MASTSIIENCASDKGLEEHDNVSDNGEKNGLTAADSIVVQKENDRVSELANIVDPIGESSDYGFGDFYREKCIGPHDLVDTDTQDTLSPFIKDLLCNMLRVLRVKTVGKKAIIIKSGTQAMSLTHLSSFHRDYGHCTYDVIVERNKSGGADLKTMQELKRQHGVKVAKIVETSDSYSFSYTRKIFSHLDSKIFEVEDMTYQPYRADRRDPCMGYATANMFPGWKAHVVSKIDVELLSIFNRFILECICGGNSDDYDQIIQWLKHLVKFPDRSPSRGLLLTRGNNEAGDLLTEFLCNCIFGSRISQLSYGIHNTLKDDDLMCAVLVVIKDANVGNTTDIAKLGDYLTRARLTYKRKGFQGFAMIRQFHIIAIPQDGESISSRLGERFIEVGSGPISYQRSLCIEFRDRLCTKEGSGAVLTWLLRDEQPEA